MAHALHDLDEFGRVASEGEESYPDDQTNSVASTWDDFFDRYTCTVEPNLRLKVRKSVKGLQCGARLAVSSPWREGPAERSWALTVRPLDRDKSLRAKLLSKITLLPAEGEIHWRMRKVQLLKYFKVKLAAGYDWKQQRGSLVWNVTTKWNADDRKTVLKARVPLTSRSALVPHFKAVYGLPSAEGGIGTASSTPKAEVNEGYCHASLPNIDVVISLDRPDYSETPLWRKLPWIRQKKQATLERVEPYCLAAESPAMQPAPWDRPCPWRLPWLSSAERAESAHSASQQKVPLPWCLKQPLQFPWLLDGSPRAA